MQNRSFPRAAAPYLLCATGLTIVGVIVALTLAPINEANATDNDAVVAPASLNRSEALSSDAPDSTTATCEANGAWCTKAEQCCSGRCYANEQNQCCVCTPQKNGSTEGAYDPVASGGCCPTHSPWYRLSTQNCWETRADCETSNGGGWACVYKPCQ
ncbi:MAG: conotoxin [bacterium]|nr:conotoxin [bacterium]